MDEAAKIDKNERLNKNKISDSESINQGAAPQTNNVNMPNTIKYPKGGAINQSQSKSNYINNNNEQPVENNNAISGGQTNTQGNEENQEGKAKKKYSGRVLVALICVVIVYEYYAYVFYLKPLVSPSKDYFVSRLINLIFFHYFLFMMIWSFIVTMRTIPGYIPLYWGFYIGDEEYKRKRYCLICNAFKPERSHHCSVCNICVLNMDHHCPWVNNCIGFYNRKFFMQLLFYLLIILYYILLSCIGEIYEIVKHMYISRLHLPVGKLIGYAIVVPAYILIIVLTVLNTMFLKYHITLVLNNSTTIESLDPDNKESAKVCKLIDLISFFLV